MTKVDKTLPHQIAIVAISSEKKALDGSRTVCMGLAVTCNCYRIGSSDHFSKIIAALPAGDAIPHAWRLWNHRSLHRDQSTFRPNEKMVEKHGIVPEVLSR